MSLYIGEDGSGKNIMHISKDTRTAAELSDGVLDDTIFHTDVPYLRYESFAVNGVHETVFARTSDGRTNFFRYITKIPLPDEARVLINQGYAFSLLDSNYNIVKSLHVEASLEGDPDELDGYSYPFSRVAYAPEEYLNFPYDIVLCNYDEAYNLIIFGHEALPTTLIVYNVHFDGTLDMLPKAGNEVVINNSQVSVQNIDVLGLKFVQKESFPSSRSININTALNDSAAELSLINYDDTGSGVTFSSSDGVTVIKKGNTEIFNTLYPFPKLLFSSFTAYQGALNTTTSLDLVNLVNLGDLSNYIGGVGAVVVSNKGLTTFSIEAGDHIVNCLSKAGSGIIYNGTFYRANATYLLLRLLDGTLYISTIAEGSDRFSITVNVDLRLWVLS